MDTNLDWLNEMVKEFPVITPQRRNIIEIAGFNEKEIPISNLLAFYFDKTEEHGFSRLFVDSLLDAYEDKMGDDKSYNRDMFSGDYSVEKEMTTDSRKRIDIIIKSDDEWAIIIENKINAGIKNNDLNNYWNHVEAKNKIGIVLSIHDIKDDVEEKHMDFINIRHQELVGKVKQNLSNCYMDADDRHLMFLKEYILNIESMYNTKNNEDMEKILKLFQDNHKEISELINMDEELKKYIAKSVHNVMGEFGFEKSGANHFLASSFGNNKLDYKILSKFRIWVNHEHLTKHNSFLAYFELYSKNSSKDNIKYGKQLKERLIEKQMYNKSGIAKGDEGNNYYYQIYKLDIALGDNSENFEERLRIALRENFFKKRFIEIAVLELKTIIDEEKKKA